MGKDGRKDGRARQGGAEAERPQDGRRTAEESKAAAERGKAKGGRADHSRAERGAEKHAKRRRRRRTKGAHSASAVIFSIVVPLTVADGYRPHQQGGDRREPPQLLPNPR